jgi:hypothetical protein
MLGMEVFYRTLILNLSDQRPEQWVDTHKAAGVGKGSDRIPT